MPHIQPWWPFENIICQIKTDKCPISPHPGVRDAVHTLHLKPHISPRWGNTLTPALLFQSISLKLKSKKFKVFWLLSLQSMCRANRGTVSGYFLAGRYMFWLPVSMCSTVTPLWPHCAHWERTGLEPEMTTVFSVRQEWLLLMHVNKLNCHTLYHCQEKSHQRNLVFNQTNLWQVFLKSYLVMPITTPVISKYWWGHSA